MTKPMNDVMSIAENAPLWALTIGQARFNHDLAWSGSMVARGAL